MSQSGKAPRGLTPQEAESWNRLAATVTPLPGRKAEPKAGQSGAQQRSENAPKPQPAAKRPKPHSSSAARPTPSLPHSSTSGAPGLDSHWERRIKAGGLEPDFTLDLHGHGLDAAYHRLDDGIAQARAMNARVILLIAGKHRPVEAADRGVSRGAIRAKVLDWLAAGRHGSSIAAIRKAHRRHGGEGALYLVLKRER